MTFFIIASWIFFFAIIPGLIIHSALKAGRHQKREEARIRARIRESQEATKTWTTKQWNDWAANLLKGK